MSMEKRHIKWLFDKLIILLLASSLILSSMLYYQGRKIRADQGFVKDNLGKEWRLVRMQTFGVNGEWIAVYR